MALAAFGRAMRMDNPKDFSRVFRQAKRTGGQGLTILSLENTLDHPRLGMAIAKKHIKLATRRNRLKRLIRESFRQHQFLLCNMDIVVLSRADVVYKDTAQITRALERHWLAVKAQWKKS